MTDSAKNSLGHTNVGHTVGDAISAAERNSVYYVTLARSLKFSRWSQILANVSSVESHLLCSVWSVRPVAMACNTGTLLYQQATYLLYFLISEVTFVFRSTVLTLSWYNTSLHLLTSASIHTESITVGSLVCRKRDVAKRNKHIYLFTCLQLQFLILQCVSILWWFQLTCRKFIHCDATTRAEPDADTCRDKAVNRYQQQQIFTYLQTLFTLWCGRGLWLVEGTLTHLSGVFVLYFVFL